jgi:hypothetical protein
MSAIIKYARLWIVLWLAAAASACYSQPTYPPSATVTEIQPSTRPARSPDCNMPVLRVDPTVDYQKIAIVDGWGSLRYSEDEVMDVVKRKACETGADALLVIDSTQQENHKILYEGAPNPAHTSQSADQAQGDYILDREKVPEIGSVGHPGTYVDAVAIIYTDPAVRR